MFARAKMSGRIFHLENKPPAISIHQLDGRASHGLTFVMGKSFDEIPRNYIHVIHDV
jgi:hypothetical protein